MCLTAAEELVLRRCHYCFAANLAHSLHDFAIISCGNVRKQGFEHAGQSTDGSNASEHSHPPSRFPLRAAPSEELFQQCFKLILVGRFIKTQNWCILTTYVAVKIVQLHWVVVVKEFCAAGAISAMFCQA